MEMDLQEKLEDIYNFRIEVKFLDFRKYEIYCKTKLFEFCIPIIYDGRFTIESNIENAVHKIDKEILKFYKKGD